jgi:hypothetical protein
MRLLQDVTSPRADRARREPRFVAVAVLAVSFVAASGVLWRVGIPSPVLLALAGLSLFGLGYVARTWWLLGLAVTGAIVAAGAAAACWGILHGLSADEGMLALALFPGALIFAAGSGACVLIGIGGLVGWLVAWPWRHIRSPSFDQTKVVARRRCG